MHSSHFIFPLLLATVGTNAEAGVSVLGFSGGDDTFTLSGILAQAVQQVAVLKDIATFSSDAVKDAEFMKDVYDTADDVASGRWQDLSAEYLGDILGADPEIAQIYANSQTLISGNFPRGAGFRTLVHNGLAQSWFQVFSAYPQGSVGMQYSIADYHSVTLDNLAQSLTNAARKQQEKDRLSHICDQGLADCQKLAARMTVQQATSMQHLLDLQAAQASAAAAQQGIATDEKKAQATAQQNDVATVLHSFDKTTGTAPTPKDWNVEDFQR